MIIVLYDDLCPLCEKEIRFYKSRVTPNKFLWKKISKENDFISECQFTRKDALKYLHVRDNNDKWHRGVSGFIIIWRQMRYFKLLAILVNVPLVKQFAEILYWVFAKWRFKRLKHCQKCKD